MSDNAAQRADPVRLLRDRAESFWRDSVVLREDGDLHAAVCYRTVAEELRKCADEIEAYDPPPAPLVADPALVTYRIAAGTKVPRRRR
jgi:hypothetical protein